jgi:hypothetical protein
MSAAGRRKNWTGKITVLVAVAALMMGTGCTKKKVEEPYLIRVKSQTLTTTEFKQAVGAALVEAFGGDRNIDLPTLNDLRMRVMKQVSEEMMIAAFAAERGIAVSDEELEQAVAAVKADYPDDTFEETLLENAVSFQFWRKQLASRLLIDKVIAQELIQPVQIEADDIAQYFKANYPGGIPKDEDSDAINQRIIIHLRRQKAESSYQEWIDGLRSLYPIEVDSDAWKGLIMEEYGNSVRDAGPNRTPPDLQNGPIFPPDEPTEELEHLEDEEEEAEDGPVKAGS